MQARSRIAFQGELGAFGHAAVSLVAADAEPVPIPTFGGVVTAVRDGLASIGVLPIENVIAGPVHASVAALRSAPNALLINEVTVPVRLCLLVVPGTSMDTLREVHSQDIALAQCQAFLSKHPRIVTRHAHDTAGAAQRVAQARNAHVAAIASELAAERYQLEVLAGGIEDRPGNATRFAVFALVNENATTYLRARHACGNELASRWLLSRINRHLESYE